MSCHLAWNNYFSLLRKLNAIHLGSLSTIQWYKVRGVYVCVCVSNHTCAIVFHRYLFWVFFGVWLRMCLFLVTVICLPSEVNAVFSQAILSGDSSCKPCDSRKMSCDWLRPSLTSANCLHPSSAPPTLCCHNTHTSLIPPSFSVPLSPSHLYPASFIYLFFTSS